MATKGQIIKVWIENGEACMAVRAPKDHNADGVDIDVEYIGRVAYTPEFAALPKGQQKAALLAAVKAARDAQRPQASPDLASISGSVDL